MGSVGIVGREERSGWKGYGRVGNGGGWEKREDAFA